MRRMPLHKNQTGIVSFFVVMIIMIVLTLIVLAFAQLVRREQRQSLDRQLKTQSLYAAESGVNDAIDWLTKNPDFDPDDWGDDCDDFIAHAGLNSQLDGPGGVISYSCLLVDPAPDSLERPATTTASAAFQLQPQSDVIRSLRISWTDASAGTSTAGCPAVGSYTGDGTNGSQPCQMGTLRLELLPFNGPTARSAMIDSRYIAYVQPRTGGTAEVTFANGDERAQGQSVAGSCSGGVCTVEVINIPALTFGYLRIGSIYRSSNVIVQAFSANNPGASDTPLEMTGSQVEIDATGKANDVLHRIKVNHSLAVDGDGPAPEFGLQSRLTQCKRFELPSGNVVLFPGDVDIPRCNPLQGATPN